MRRPTRSLVLGGTVILAAIAFLIYQGISSNLVYYITPGELLAKGALAQGQTFRLGGQVRPGSVHWNGKTKTVRFDLQDADGKAEVSVTSHGQPPRLFREGTGCVVEGSFTGRVFSATNLMIKHSSDYRAPKPGDTPVPDNFKPST
jgi:cytochrome c-type biogenesis protein CcmE